MPRRYRRFCFNCGQIYEGQGKYYCSNSCHMQYAHPLLGKTRSQRVKNLLSNAQRKYFFDEQMLKKCDTPEKAYWIGYLMADGYVGNGQTLTLTSKDKELLEKFKSYFKLPYPIKKVKDTRWNNISTIYRLFLYSRKLINDLAQYGIIPRKTGKEQIKNIPPEYIRDFIRGFFDGDGCIRNQGKYGVGKSFELISSNKFFLKKILDILIKENNIPSIKIRKTHCPKVWTFSFARKKSIEKIFNFLYNGATIYLERKFLKWDLNDV